MNLIAYMGNNSLEYAGISRADLYVAGVIEKKVQALDYTSRQFYRGSYSRKRAETDNGAYGNNICVVYAKQFQRFFLWLVARHPLLARIT
ncbi:MAG: hypothetical protein QGH37_28900 [Candidatus Poribacteria bacterium]|jgi:hypothetical protein|nr:hypothetical protein [Candidatus Poribacteria bacterium]